MQYLYLYSHRLWVETVKTETGSVNARRYYCHLDKAGKSNINKESWRMVIVQYVMFKQSLNQPVSVTISADPIVKLHHLLAQLIQITYRHATFTSSSAKYFQLPQPELFMLCLNASL